MMMITIDFLFSSRLHKTMLIDHSQDVLWVLFHLSSCLVSLPCCDVLTEAKAADAGSARSECFQWANRLTSARLSWASSAVLSNFFFLLEKLLLCEWWLNCTWDNDWWRISSACRDEAAVIYYQHKIIQFCALWFWNSNEKNCPSMWRAQKIVIYGW